MKSVMNHTFSRIPHTDIPHSTFDRSHGLKTAFNSGYLIPIECQEVLPGDIVEMDAKFFARLAPVVTPIMDNVFLETQWFFVPNRLIWSNWTKMMGERVSPNDSIDYLVPQPNSIGSSGIQVGSLGDYFGLPTGVPGIKFSALPFRAYAKIWDDWYRDENLQESILKSSNDIGDSVDINRWLALNTLRKRGKRHDYFTSCLPWPQKGDGVELPLGATAPVIGNGNALGFVTGQTGKEDQYLTIGNPSSSTIDCLAMSASGGSVGASGSHTTNLSDQKLVGVSTTAANSGLIADLSTATAATINSLRMAFQLQRMLETDARGGTRYVELIRSHFKTICPDARLQRSEYLGGSSELIQMSAIPQTSATGSDGTPQGNLVAQAKCFSGCKFKKAFTEHGYLIGLANVRVDLNYQQGMNRMWSRRGRYDFFWPTLQNLGEQAVLNKEIYCQGPSVKDSDGNVIDDKVFGYQERFAEYRYSPSIITGKMRSTATDSLDVWHLAQHFTALPTLSADFIEDTPPLSRVLAVTDEPEILFDAYLGQKWTRPMATYSIPGLIDHL